MRGAPAGVAAGQVGFLITNGGNHTPEAWAKTTAKQLIERDPRMTEKRLEYGVLLFNGIEALLISAFHSGRVDSSDMELARTAAAVQGQIAGLAAETPWEDQFCHESVANIMRELIFCNLRTAADLAVRTE